MRQFINAMSSARGNLLLEFERLGEGDVVPFPGNPRPVDSLAVARGGAEVRGFPEHVELDEFASAYVVAALWSSDDDNQERLDKNYDISGIASPTLQKMAADCADFQKRYHDLLDAAYERGYSVDYAGHDFWLTRNRHGAGFWDRNLDRIGEQLTAAAHRYGDFDLYVGDDKMIHGV